MSHEQPLLMQTSGETSCPLDMSRLLIMDFVATLEDEAAQNGSLDIGLLRSVAEDFLRSLRNSGPVPQDCLQMHQRLLWDERRRHPFERLLVKRFSPLLPARHGDEGGSQRTPAPLSRRAIPGLMVAVIKMVGPDHFGACEAATREIIKRHKERHPGPIDWDDLAGQDAVRRLVDLALVSMAAHFLDFEKRLSWLISVVNGHLPPPPPEDGTLHWVMNRRSAIYLLGALYQDLRQRLQGNRRQLETDIGHYGLANLLGLHGNLNRVEDGTEPHAA